MAERIETGLYNRIADDGDLDRFYSDHAVVLSGKLDVWGDITVYGVGGDGGAYDFTPDRFLRLYVWVADLPDVWREAGDADKGGEG